MLSVFQINSTKKAMLLGAWTNMCVYNNTDGSQDGDVNTLQRNLRPEVEFTNDNKLSVKEMQRRVTIRHRTTRTKSGRPPVTRKPCTYRPLDYDVTALKPQSRGHEKPTTLWERFTRMDCHLLNAPQKRVYDEAMARDVSNLDAAVPDTRWMITPSDVKALFAVVEEVAGREKAEFMQTHKLGLPIRRKSDGAIVIPASPSPKIDWPKMKPTPRFWREDNTLRDEIVDSLHIPGVSRNVDYPPGSVDPGTFDIEEMHEELVESAVRFNNPHWDDEMVRAYAPLIYKFSVVKPEERVTTTVTTSTRKALRSDVRRGISIRSGYDFSIAFVKFVEANGALFRMDAQQFVVTDGVFSLPTMTNHDQP